VLLFWHAIMDSLSVFDFVPLCPVAGSRRQDGTHKCPFCTLSKDCCLRGAVWRF